MSSTSQKQIGNYTYNERHCLGEGAYGKVYQGQNTKTNETVAIKKLDLVMFERDQYLRNQIVQEIEILKKFNHPNIVRFGDLITTQRSLYIVTEFCKDGDLKELLLKKKLTEVEVQEIIIQIVNGFKELVRLGIIHRDLKPANILNHEGIVKIADFGFAKYVDNYTSQLLRSCVGSPLYMAPQVLSRKSYSTKCDIWSIGVMYYEMLFHDVPWKGRDEQDLLKNILIKPLVLKNNVTYSKFSEDFLRKALSVEESDRLSWEQVFALFDNQASLLVGNSDILKRLSFEGKPAEKEEELESVQKVPTWMDKVSAKGQNLNSDQVQKNLKQCILLRQEITFKHFVCVELHMKQDILRPYCKKDIALDEIIGLLSKSVLSASNCLIQVFGCIFTNYIQSVTETCDCGENSLMKGTKWNILTQLKAEHEYYQMFYDDYKEIIVKNESIVILQNYDEFKSFYDQDVSDAQRQKLDDYLLRRQALLCQDICDEFRRRIPDKYYAINNFEAGIAADYLMDLVLSRKRQQKNQDVDYDLMHSEKSFEDDIKKVLERLQSKLKLSQTN